MRLSKDQLFSSKSQILLTIVLMTMILIPFSDLIRVFAEEGIITSITVENGPIEFTYNPDTGNLYVSNYGSDSVSVIDSDTNRIITSITVGSTPYGLTYNPYNQYIYVANQASDTVSVIDSDTNRVVDTITVEDLPSGVAYNVDNGYVYVANQGSDSVSVINPNTNRVVDTIAVGDGPVEVTFADENSNLYVSNYGSASISIINPDTNRVVDTVTVGQTPLGMAYNPDKGYIYVANQASKSVSVIDVSSNRAIDSITVEAGPSDVAYNRDNGYVYVTNFSSNTVSVIDSRTNEVIDTVKLIDGEGPHGVAYNPSNKNVYVAHLGNYGLHIFSKIVSVIGSIIPISDAGPNQNVDPGTEVKLDGSGSSDPRNQTLTYQWTQTAGPEVTLSDPRAENPTFNAPDTLLPQRLMFELVVTNEDGLVSKPDSVTITINPDSNPSSPFEGILGSGNNINIQVQKNSGNNVGAQFGFGGMYSDSPIFQGQSTEQDSDVVS